MKKALLVLVCALFLQASGLQNLVKGLLPEEIYLKNGPLISTLFANSSKYMGQTGYDYQKIFSALERVGVLREALGSGEKRILRYIGDRRPFLLLHLSELALESGNVYRYGASSFATVEQGFECGYSITTNSAISFAKMIAFLKRNGVVIKEVHYGDGGWEFWLDMNGAHLQLPKVVGSVEFRGLGSPLWVEVCGASKVKIQAFGRYWHPDVAMYDADLAPMDLYKSYEPTKRLELALPNGACYIKISDIFTPKNIKRGFRISLE